MKQSTAGKILKSGKNVFLTGSAGTGKTYLLALYIKYLRKKRIAVSVTASTGIAATHLEGMTIHSWSGLGIRESLSPEELKKMMRKRELRKRLKKNEVLIIDEISMLSAPILDRVDQILRYFKEPFEPFGGTQIIVCGDFFQLPPVSKNHDESLYAFNSHAWKEAHFQVCYLTEQYRQTKSPLMYLLNEIRSGRVSYEKQKALEEKVRQSHNVKEDDYASVRLYTHNWQADSLNKKALHELGKPLKTFKAKAKGSERIIKTLVKSMLAPQTLEVSEGAAVMFVRNNAEKGYFNGTRGTVVGYDEEGYPEVQILSGEVISATPEEWKVLDENDEPLASVLQVPLRLAWAITVHKSQGMTLESAEIDLTNTFEKGQGYVALSRVKDWEGLTLKGFNEKSLQINSLILQKDDEFKTLSNEAEKGIAVLNSRIENHSTTSYTTVDLGCKEPHKHPPEKFQPQYGLKGKRGKVKTYSFDEVRKTHKHAYEPWTKEADKKLEVLFYEGKKIKELSEFFGRNEGAIRSRIKKLELKEKYTKFNPF